MAFAKVVKHHGANTGYHRIIIGSIDPRTGVECMLYSYANKSAAAVHPPLKTHHTHLDLNLSPAAGKNIIKLCYEAIKKKPADTFTTIDLTGATLV